MNEERRPKNVRLAEFEPRSGFAWEEVDIDKVVGVFRGFLKQAWKDGHYLRLDKRWRARDFVAAVRVRDDAWRWLSRACLLATATMAPDLASTTVRATT